MRFVTAVDIGLPIERVFDFVTTPANWPRWHPASLRVLGCADHPLLVGEQVTEEFRVAGQPGSAVWTVREREAPHRWVIDGASENGNRAIITYTLTARDGGTLFQRELVFVAVRPRDESMDPAELGRRIETESAEALRRLKEVLEKEGEPRGDGYDE
jgi:uncharacterized protein YndB with AHSA1/START domain